MLRGRFEGAQFIAQQQAKVDKRYLSAWGEVVPFGRGYVWRWHQGGLPGMLAAIHQCKTVSLTADAAWVQFAAVVRAAVGGKSRTAAGERER